MVIPLAAAQSRLVVFDLCDTLYAANTSVGFLRYYAEATNNRRIARRVNRWLDRRSPFFYLGAVLHRFARYDLPRQRMIASLAGESRQQLAAIARDYARLSLPALTNALVHERMAAHRAAGDRIILVSSSLDLVVEQVAAQLGTEYRASVLEWSGDICTGRLVSDLTGRKATVVQELLAGQSAYLKVYTDNRSDRGLVAMADEATIIIPRGAASDHWAGESHEYLAL